MPSFNVLICAATRLELHVLKWPLKQAKLLGTQIDFLTTGIGNLETTHTLSRYITKNQKPDLIINIGIAGHADPDIPKIPHQILQIIHHQTEKEILLASHLPSIPILKGICSDLKIINPDEIPKKCLVDMESWAVSWFAQKHHISKIILKIPYDFVGNETRNFSKEACTDFLAAIDMTETIETLKNCIKRNVQ